jgi:PAS domain S-box-containing protein
MSAGDDDGAAEAELRALVGALPDVVLVVDGEGRVLKEAATSAPQLLGPRGLQVGRLPHDLFPKDLADRLLGCVRDALARTKPAQLEYAVDVDGRRHWFVGTAVPIATDRVLWVAREITEVKEIAEQLLQSQKMDAIGRLAGGIAHDFNNLLTVMATNVALASRDVARGSTAAHALENVKHATERAAALTRQLLAFSRRQVLAPRVIDLNEVVAHAEQMLSRVIGEDVALVTALESEAVSVLADAGQLEQVLLNLVVNARDAMPHGGRLHITTELRSAKEPRPAVGTTIPEGEYAVLSVRDTGMGIDPSTRARIFEPFFTTKPVGAGTGLGLSMVYGIASQSNGYVRVESELGVGSTFEIHLPRHDAPSGADAPRASKKKKKEPATLDGRERILIVEDEPAVRRAIERSLRERGYEVLVAADGIEARQIIRREHFQAPDLIVTDVVMPEVAGGEVAALARERWPDVEVLLVSGYADDVVFRQGMPSGAELLEKPFDGETLARAIRTMLDRRKS